MSKLAVVLLLGLVWAPVASGAVGEDFTVGVYYAMPSIATTDNFDTDYGFMDLARNGVNFVVRIGNAWSNHWAALKHWDIQGITSYNRLGSYPGPGNWDPCDFHSEIMGERDFYDGMYYDGEYVGDACIGYVFQEPRLLPWKTAVDNVAIGLRADGTSKREARDVARMWMNKLGLEGFEEYYPAQLSGGMKQRVATGRALAIKPNILLMDEPCSHLDADLKESLLEMIQGVFRQYRTTVVYVTHDLAEAVRLSDRVLRIASGSTMQELDLSDREALIHDHVLGWLRNERPAEPILERPLARSDVAQGEASE